MITKDTIFGPYPHIGKVYDVANHYKHLGYRTRVDLAKGTVKVFASGRKTSHKLTGARITSHMNEADFNRKYGGMFQD